MLYNIQITELAEQDLEDIGDYIAFKLMNPQASVNTIRGIRAQINKLGFMPERNDLDEDDLLAKLGIRMDYYRKYKIYYFIDDSTNTVYIVRILHMLVDSRVWLYKSLGID